MKTKVFIANENGKVEFTEKELRTLLDEIYDEGYFDGKKSREWWYTTPFKWNTPTTTATEKPYTITYTTSTSCDTNIKKGPTHKKIKWSRSSSDGKY